MKQKIVLELTTFANESLGRCTFPSERIKESLVSPIFMKSSRKGNLKTKPPTFLKRQCFINELN